jgi:Protein of unknown function (DUF1570)
MKYQNTNRTDCVHGFLSRLIEREISADPRAEGGGKVQPSNRLASRFDRCIQRHRRDPSHLSNPGAGGIVLVCVCFCFVVGVTPSAAELVYFAAGGQAQIPATVEGSTVRLEMPDRVLNFQLSDFRKIVPGFWPEREWSSRKAAAGAGGAPERFAAAWWALENGLTPQAEAMLREAHKADLLHQPTALMVAVLDRLNQPCGDPEFGSLRNSLGVVTEVARGPHVLLLHQHTEAGVRERIDVAERVLTTYYLVLAAQGMDLPTPRTRLVSTWFARQSDYLAFLHSEHADAFRTTNGYYHPTRGLVVSYDLRSSGPQTTSRAALSSRRKELDRARERLREQGSVRLNVSSAPVRAMSRDEAQAVLDRLDRDVDRQQMLLDLDCRAVDLGTTAHELIHQLVALTRLAPEHRDFPLWLHEGFAAQFEVIRGGRWAGFSRAHDARLADWRKIQPAPALNSLVRDEGFGNGYRAGLYAEAWSLVYFLRKQHPQSFTTFLDLLRAPHNDSRSRTDRIPAAFRAAFGEDMNSIETEWHKFMLGIATPLEAEQPGH